MYAIKWKSDYRTYQLLKKYYTGEDIKSSYSYWCNYCRVSRGDEELLDGLWVLVKAAQMVIISNASFISLKNYLSVKVLELEETKWKGLFEHIHAVEGFSDDKLHHVVATGELALKFLSAIDINSDEILGCSIHKEEGAKSKLSFVGVTGKELFGVGVDESMVNAWTDITNKY